MTVEKLVQLEVRKTYSFFKNSVERIKRHDLFDVLLFPPVRIYDTVKRSKLHERGARRHVFNECEREGIRKP